MQENESTPEDDAEIGIAFRKSLIVIVCVALVVAFGFAITQFLRTEEVAEVKPIVEPTRRVYDDVKVPELLLTEISEAAGVRFLHFNGATGEKLLPETMGSGCAFLDYDNDGDQDLFLVNGNRWPWVKSETDEPALTSMLFENDGTGKFTDVTAETGTGVSTYGMGLAVGDIDNDGWRDIFISGVGTGAVTDVGANRLLKNNQGKFTELAVEAGVAGAGDSWGTSCGMIDYNNDGLLDLFVCNYVRWSRKIDLEQGFKIDGKQRAYGRPTNFSGTLPVLYHNEGNGKFVDVSEAAGVQIRNRDTGVPLAKGMGVAPVDVNGDGWIDLIMANDTVRNLLYINQKDGTFQEVGELTGIAYDRDGKARGAMGIDVAPFRSDGTLAVCIGNFANEMSALYMYRPSRNQFFDAAMATGLGPPTRQGLTFGMLFCDVDLDGRLDVVGANGHLEQEISLIQQSQRYEQPMQLFWNAGLGASSELVHVPQEKTGASFAEPIVGRSSALADIDGDGDVDLVVTTNGGLARLFRNDQSLGNHWIRLKLVGSQSNRDAIGAKVSLKYKVRENSVIGPESRERTVHAQVMPTRSYLGQSELPITFGLGKSSEVLEINVSWPSGTTQTITSLQVDALSVIEESKAR